jgi:uncharacterized membrane protein
MTELVKTYVPMSVAAHFRRQANRVWIGAIAVSLAWVLLIIAAPLAKANGFTSVSAPLFAFFGNICHQMSARSFHIEGEQFGVCSRCFGVYFGLVAGFLAYPLWRQMDEIDPIPRMWLFLSLVPIGIDWSLGIFGIWENTHLSRFVTGGILGVSCATFIMPALVEITRNLTVRRQQRKAA